MSVPQAEEMTKEVPELPEELSVQGTHDLLPYQNRRLFIQATVAGVTSNYSGNLRTLCHGQGDEHKGASVHIVDAWRQVVGQPSHYCRDVYVPWRMIVSIETITLAGKIEIYRASNHLTG